MTKFDLKALTVAAAVALLASGCGDSAESSEATTTQPRRVAVRVATLQTEAATDIVSLPADLRPSRRSVLAAEVPGRVESITVREGDRVTRGQLLMTIDGRSLEQTVREAEAVYFQRTQQFSRAENLFAKQSITKAQMLDALTLRDVAQASLDSAKLQLSKSRLVAPWSGRVAVRSVELGDYVQPGQPVVELIDVEHLEVRAPVAAADVPFVAVGSPVLVRVDAYPGEIFEATIVRTGAELDVRSRTLEVEAELDNADGRLKPGLPTRIEIVRREWPTALLVPAQAVIELDSEDAVYVVDGDFVVRRAVQLGPTLGDRVLVESGLVPGDKVVVEGMRRVSEGQTVEIVESEGTV
ncbi:MAG: efflux RND transporter periplasmic adaptor subunit [Thermoanaerobaculia bacterium]|nr:efflux RND transporter periplasmic adaptor subunit [Thermoanaerobaculia bacterium]